MNKAKNVNKDKEEQFTQTNTENTIKSVDSNDMVDNLDTFLEDDEINR